MHPQAPALTIGGTVLKESDDLQTLNAEFYIAGESYTGLCLAILQ